MKIVKSIVLFSIVFSLVSCTAIDRKMKVYSAEKIVSYFSHEDFLPEKQMTGNWYDNYNVIAHALGGIDGKEYTNSYNALVSNYNKGTRIFETDLSYTSDGYLVLVHEWNQYHNDFQIGEKDGWSEESLSFFKSNLIYNKYLTMTFEEMLYIMNAIPDIYLVLDTKTFDKESNAKMYEEIIEKINEVNPELAKRIIPQAYTPELYNQIENFHFFDEIIFTLYHYYVESDGYKIFNFIRENKVKVVVMHMNDDWAKAVIRDIRDYAMYDELWDYSNLRIYIHTINDYDIARDIIHEEKFYGIYSDYISENDFVKEIE